MMDNSFMDPYLQLKYEFNSIKAIIGEYTGHGPVFEYLNGLDNSINSIDDDGIKYYLGRISQWYKDNISSIRSNQYVDAKDQKEHSDNMELIDSLNKRFENYDFKPLKKNTHKERSGEKRIFLSHCSKDKKYGNALEKLLTGFGVKEEQLIYTSHPLHKIPLGAKIFDYLRENINDQVFMIIIWSNDYLESPACLAEMGAAWVLQTTTIGMYTPDFLFENPKYHNVPLDRTEMGAVLNGNDNCRISMIEFKDKILEFLGLDVDEKKCAYLIDQFMKDIG